MNTMTSTFGRALYAAAFVALHFFAAFAVVVYAVTIGVIGLLRWCSEIFRRPLAERESPALAATES